MKNKITLYNPQAEVEVLSACIFNPYVLEYVRELLSDDLFSDYKCIKAYQIIKQLEAEGKQPELVEIGMRLKAENINISEFYADTDSSTLTEQRIYVLKDLAIRRKLSALLFKGQTMVDDTTITIDDLQKLFGEFDDVLTQREGAESHSFGSVLTRLMNNVALRKENKGEQGIMTGLHIFDSRYGWHGGDLIIIAGETSQGKSTLATTICYNIAANDVPCLYLSLEMGEEQLVSRIIARSTQVSSSTTLYGRISDEEYNRLYDGSLQLKDLPIYFEEDSKSNFPKMMGAIRRQVKNNKVKVVFIDYLQILANGGRDNREAIIGDMARDLKRLAAELNIVIVALSQLARPSGGASKEPTLNRMRGSGQIEEACDIAVLIYRPNLKTEKANIYIAKGRNIGLGKETIKFNSSLSYFSDFEDGDPDAPYSEKKEELPF